MPNEADDLNVRLARMADNIAEMTGAVDELGTLALQAATDLEVARRLLHRLHGILLPGFLHEEGCDCEDDGDCACQDLAAFRRVMQGWTPPKDVEPSAANTKET